MDFGHLASLLAPLTNLCLIVVFILHLAIRFRPNKLPFLKWWLFFWIALLCQYLLIWIPVSMSSENIESEFQSTALAALGLLNALALIIGYEAIPTFKESGSISKLHLLIWTAIFVAAFLGILIKHDQGLLISNLGWFLALCLFAGKYQHMSSYSRTWIAVLIYIYAGLDVFFSFSNFPRPNTALVLMLLAMPLKIALYFAGYSLLLEIEKLSSPLPVPIEAAPKINLEDKLIPGYRKAPPDPSVAVQLSGLWAFLYLLWCYPSGRLVVLVIVGSMASALFVLLTNLAAVASVLKTLVAK